jgi:hypothetical protein
MSQMVKLNDRMYITPEGGFAIKLTNETGSNSVKGQIVAADTGTANAFNTSAVDDEGPIGVVYEAGIADGSECLVVISGRAQVLLKDTTASTQGNWVKCSDTAGRADATNASPVATQEARGVGECIETQAGGSDVLAYVMIQTC